MKKNTSVRQIKVGERFSFRLTLFIICLIFGTSLLVTGFYLIMMLSGLIKPTQFRLSPFLLFALTTIVSSAIGFLFFIIFGRHFTKPITDLTEATQKVASGNFDVEIERNGNPEMETLIDNFNKMVEDLKKNETLKNDFIANVSHEFKTPLSNIQGYAMLLQEENLNEQDKYSYTQAIIESSKNLTELVSNILKLTKLENQEEILECKDYSLDEQIRQSILIYETQWTEKNIDLNVDLEDLRILNDESLLLQVWNNLISNAIKFSNQNGKISICLRKEDDEAVVTIEDNGIGMEEKVVDRIFDKFYQGDNSHFKNGNGLGLAIVKRIIEIVNGKIGVESKIKEGSKFFVRIPLRNE